MIKQFLIELIRIYQRKHFKPRFYRRCIYYPTCSEYTIQAIQKYGLIKGGWIAFQRYKRCTASHPGGVDPLI